jgi:hypothetical protein
VNAYNESRELVQRYVDAAGLRQTVLLGGRDTARYSYRVGAYPTSFWIDATGVLVDSEVGFLPSRVPAMEKRLEKLLEARGGD